MRRGPGRCRRACGAWRVEGHERVPLLACAPCRVSFLAVLLAPVLEPLGAVGHPQQAHIGPRRLSAFATSARGSCEHERQRHERCCAEFGMTGHDPLHMGWAGKQANTRHPGQCTRHACHMIREPAGDLAKPQLDSGFRRNDGETKPVLKVSLSDRALTSSTRAQVGLRPIAQAKWR